MVGHSVQSNLRPIMSHEFLRRLRTGFTAENLGRVTIKLFPPSRTLWGATHGCQPCFSRGRRSSFRRSRLEKRMVVQHSGSDCCWKVNASWTERFALTRFFWGDALGRMRSKDCKMSLDLVWVSQSTQKCQDFRQNLRILSGFSSDDGSVEHKAGCFSIATPWLPRGERTAGPVYQSQENGNLSIRRTWIHRFCGIPRASCLKQLRTYQIRIRRYDIKIKWNNDWNESHS